jgi:acid stress chaperone HdeA
MNKKHATISLMASALLISSTVVFAVDKEKNDSLEAGLTAPTGTNEPSASTAPTPTAEAMPATATTPAPTPAPAAKVDSTKKPLAKVTCEDFLAFDEVIQPKYVIAAAAHAKGGQPKTIVIDVVETETLVPILIEECTRTPKVSFFDKLKSKLKQLKSKL